MWTRSNRALLLLLGVLPALAFGVGTSGGASESVTVSVTVPSAITLTNNCLTPAGHQFGTVFPGSPALTATGAGICSLGFQSSNDSAQLRIGQRDNSLTAMTSPDAAWATQSTSSTFELSGLAAFDAMRAYAVMRGAPGTLRRTLDGGNSFTNFGLTGTTLWDVAQTPTDPNTWWTVGNDRWIARTTNGLAGGPTWNGLDVALGAAGWPALTDIYAISAVDVNTAFIVGENGWIAKTINAGVSWTAFQHADGTVGNLRDVSAVNANDVYALGNSKVLRTTLGGDTSAEWIVNDGLGPSAKSQLSAASATRAYVTGSGGIHYTSDGTTWNAVADQDGDGVEVLSGVSGAPGTTTAWAVGEWGTILKTTDGGVTWARQGADSGNTLGTVVAIDASNVMAGGFARELLTTSNGGTAWAVKYAEAGQDTLYGVTTSPINGRTALAVGARGTIRRTTDGGGLWTTAPSGVAYGLYGVSMGSSSIGWAVGDRQTILKTTDAGATWAVQQSIPGTVRLFAVSAVDELVAYAAGDGGLILKTTNGGSSWAVQASGTTYDLRSVSAVDATTAFAAGENATMLRTTNGGTTWSPAATPPNRSVLAVTATSATTAWATYHGTSSVWRTTDGTNWTSTSTGTWNHRTVSAFGSTVIVGALDYISRSSNAGTSYVNTGTSDMIYAVAMVDTNTAFVVGGGGIIQKTSPALVAAGTVQDYASPANDWASSGLSSMFGVCVQAISAQTTIAAPFVVDGGTCTSSDLDPWRGIPAAMTKVGTTAAAGNLGRVDFVWGMRPRSDQTPGDYQATIVFEALAPNI